MAFCLDACVYNSLFDKQDGLKMAKIIIFALLLWILIGLTGCSKPQSTQTCQNITIEKNNTITVEVLKEVNITLPCIEKPINLTKELEYLSCAKDKLKLITQLDYTRSVLSDCVDSNSTEAYDDLKDNLSDCYHDMADLNETYLDDVKDMNKTIVRLRERLNESNVTE